MAAVRSSTVRMRAERFVLGSVMSVVAWGIERVVRRSQRSKANRIGH